MVRTCFVPHCKSGYKTCKEKWSIFNAPKDPDQRETWRKLIGRKDRQLGVGDCVCEKHFPPEQIVRHWIKRDVNGQIICKIQLKQCRLAQGALPTIFPGGEKTPKKQLGTRIKPPRKPPKIRTPIVVTKKRKKCPKKVENCRKMEKNCQKNAKNDEKGERNAEKRERNLNNDLTMAKHTKIWRKMEKNGEKTVKNDEKMAENAENAEFNDEETLIYMKNPLLNIHLNFKPVGTNWRTVYDSSRAMLSVYWPEMRTNGVLYVKKQIVVTRDLLYKIYFQNVLISEENCCLDARNVVKDLCAVVADMENIEFCAGGPGEGEVLDVGTGFAYVDEGGVWRHRECTVQWVGEERSCVFCRRLRSAIRFCLGV